MITIFIILVLPIRLQYKDGGTVEYRSLTYKIIKWHRLDEYYEGGYKTGTEVHFFPNNFKPIDYFAEVKPPRFSLIYNDEVYLSEVLSYCWSNNYGSICADTLGPTGIDYDKTIEVKKNDVIHYGTYLDISSIKLYNENEELDYEVEYNNNEETVTVPELEGIYILVFSYRCPEGNVSYAFKINITGDNYEENN